MYFVFLAKQDVFWKGEVLVKGKYITNDEDFISINQISCRIIATFKTFAKALFAYPDHKDFLVVKEVIATTIDFAGTITDSLKLKKEIKADTRSTEERVYLEELVEKLEEKTDDS